MQISYSNNQCCQRIKYDPIKSFTSNQHANINSTGIKWSLFDQWSKLTEASKSAKIAFFALQFTITTKKLIIIHVTIS